jgi:SanA protein
MLRASEVFHVKTALVPTQSFHLARAVYLARASGIKVTGVPAKFRSYRGTLATVREWAARVKAFLQVHF